MPPTYCISSDLHRYKGNPVFTQFRLLATSSGKRAYCEDFEGWDARYAKNLIPRLLAGTIVPLTISLQEVTNVVDNDKSSSFEEEFWKRWPETIKRTDMAFRKIVTIELIRKAMEHCAFSWFGIRWADKLTKNFHNSLLRKIRKVGGTSYLNHRPTLCAQMRVTMWRATLLQNVAGMCQEILFKALSYFEIEIEPMDPATKKSKWNLIFNPDGHYISFRNICNYLIDRLYYHGLCWFSSSYLSATFATMDPFMGGNALGGVIGQCVGEAIGAMIYQSTPSILPL